MPLCAQEVGFGPRSVGGNFGYALRAGPRPGAKDPVTGKRPPPRAKWDDRHNVLFPNDASMPNGRSYFDRYRNRLDPPKEPGPKALVRPTWVLDEPEEKSDDTYRVFDRRTASFQTVVWKKPAADPRAKKAPGRGRSRDSKAKDKAPDPESPAKDCAPDPKPRTPRTNFDLKIQREREKSFDTYHAVTYSRNNAALPCNYRSYFDRWKDTDGASVRKTTWRLAPEPKERVQLQLPDWLSESTTSLQNTLPREITKKVGTISEPTLTQPPLNSSFAKGELPPWTYKRVFKQTMHM